MIVSHRHRFIFLKTVKTGGTSVEISLSRYCGAHDVITPISPADEQLRGELGLTPRNYLADRSEYGLRDWFRLVVQRRPAMRYWNHITAADARARLGPEVWDSYFKFTIERDPWDKTLSDFHWRADAGGPRTLDAYFRRYRGRFRQFNYPRYTIDGRVAVDFIVRFERLTTDLTAALRQVDIEFDGWLPRAKGTSRADRRHYSQVLSREQCRLVADHFAPEIDLLGYDYEDRRAAA